MSERALVRFRERLRRMAIRRGFRVRWSSVGPQRIPKARQPASPPRSSAAQPQTGKAVSLAARAIPSSIGPRRQWYPENGTECSHDDFADGSTKVGRRQRLAGTGKVVSLAAGPPRHSRCPVGKPISSTACARPSWASSVVDKIESLITKLVREHPFAIWIHWRQATLRHRQAAKHRRHRRSRHIISTKLRRSTCSSQASKAIALIRPL